MSLTIALDAMGGDFGASVTTAAALKIIHTHPGIKLILVGDKQILNDALQHKLSNVGDRIRIHHSSQVVSMDEAPATALRTKKDSSMRVALNLVKNGTAQACVSAGNTGALMATARFVLKTLPGIDRPALMTALPTSKGHCHMLDLGANIDATPEILFQFGVMGMVVSNAIDNIKQPTVGLLNIGEEEMKGGEDMKLAARLMESSEVNYYGFVEGDDIYKGTVDVVVCDGFVGNVALKTSEGLVRMLAIFLKQEFTATWRNKIAALLAKPVLTAFKRKVDPSNYNGASLVGLNGIVVKSHGGADIDSFANAIRVAVLEVEKNVPEKISKIVESFLLERQSV